MLNIPRRIEYWKNVIGIIWATFTPTPKMQTGNRGLPDLKWNTFFEIFSKWKHFRRRGQPLRSPVPSQLLQSHTHLNQRWTRFPFWLWKCPGEFAQNVHHMGRMCANIKHGIPVILIISTKIIFLILCFGPSTSVCLFVSVSSASFTLLLYLHFLHDQSL